MGVSDFAAISGLAANVHAACKDAGDEYRYISEEVGALSLLIDKAAHHFKSSAASSHDVLKILKRCQSVLEDLNSLFEKNRSLDSTNERLVLTTFKVGKEGIVALRERLISNTGLLNVFVRRFVVPSQVFHIINPMDIINIVLVVNTKRFKHGWPLFLVFTQAPEFQ